MDTSNSPLQDQAKRENSPAGLRRPIKGLFYVLIVSSLILLVSIIQGPKLVKDGDADDHVLVKLYSSLKAMLPEPIEQRLEDVKVSDEKAKAYPWSNEMLSWQRTSYHFQPQKNWMNGPLFYMGWYHFFYQYGPNSALWGNITWGHAVSKDLINWFHLPIAMVPDSWFDRDGVWTGSATILPDGQVIMLYTGGAADGTQLQNLAYPVNLSDPLLLEWVKYSGNPVMVPPPGIKEFRDPSTAWLGPDGKWRITIGSLVNDTGISLVYKTTDFKTFELLDGLLHEIPGTGMWECIDFYPVSLTTTHGLDISVNGPDIKHVLKVSMAVGMEDYYAIGTYDPINDKWTPDDPKADVGIGPRVDDGKFYASKTFYDLNKKRRINWAWVPESDSESSDLLKGWASLQTIPRTVVFDTKTRTNLLQWPVEEVESLRLGSYDFDNLKLEPGSVLPLNIGSAAQLDIVATFEIDYEALETTGDASADYKCSTSGGAVSRGILGPFGILVLADESLSELTPIYFYIIKESNGRAKKTHICADQSRSSTASDVAKPIYGSEVPVLHDEKLSMRILVDHSIVESFAQGGRRVITSRIYPTKAINGAAKLYVFNNATGVSVTASVKAWQMTPAKMNPFPPNVNDL
ncbi:Beta-fructofuranosidase [Heracleum sosnowskyi]|uniref:Beta-fructofuranosidase n=1 Tax=Heracleum sosnowskyi TaxID=360622 RepID=A0AAD8H4Q6_9APIA|nr:Beta-fructofuranosidase [Heracleum sosnowskyi]